VNDAPTTVGGGGRVNTADGATQLYPYPYPYPYPHP